MHKDIERILFPKEDIDGIVSDMAERINKDFAGKEIIAVVVLKGSIMFGADLVRKLNADTSIDFIQASSYGFGTASTGKIKIKKDLDFDIKGRHVLIIEDIIDSGRTLSLLKKNFKERNAASVSIASLLSKPSRRVVDVGAEYIGAEIPDEFVVGYGLDYAEKYRGLEYIGILKREIYSK